MIPGLEQAEYMRYGVMHRNTFLDSPRLLHADFSLRERPGLFFAGQMTGVEGYMESAASGLLAGRAAAAKYHHRKPISLPPETMMGALSRYVSSSAAKSFQPMGANFGILPPLSVTIRNKQERYAALADRALQCLSDAMQAEKMESEEQA